MGDDLFEGVATGISRVKATRAGFILADGEGTYDPPWPTVPGGEFQVGKRWCARTIQTSKDGKREWMDVDPRIVAREVIEVPIGIFDTYRVEVTMRSQSGRVRKLTNWFDPDWAYAVRQLSQSALREMKAMKRAAH